MIAKSCQIIGIDAIQHLCQWLQRECARFALAVIPQPDNTPHHLLDFRVLGRHRVNAFLFEGVADPGEPSHKSCRFARFTITQLPSSFFFIEPYPVSQYPIGLICQKVHDVVMGRLQWIQTMQLAPEDKNPSIRLIGIEGRICFGTAQEAASTAI